MEFLSIRKFNSSPKDTQEKLAKEGKIVLTNNGQPMALVISLTSENFEDTLAAVRQVESLRLLKSMRAEAKNRGLLSPEEIEAEIQTARSERLDQLGRAE